jgi:2-amino-4-hydroxy-6-hydroxymethyldihydropteridine diphosphokinase
VADAFIALGSNIEPARNIARALRRLARHGRLTGISTVYHTPPEDRPEQPWYYNCVVCLRTQTPAAQLKADVLRRIEDEFGRVRTEDKYAPRTIDLDLVLYDDLVVTSDELTLPDPRIEQRAYLARGVHELAPDLTLPNSGRAIAAVVAELPASEMVPLVRFTGRMRRMYRACD